MRTLILLTRPQARQTLLPQPLTLNPDLLELQNAVYETLTVSLNRLHESKHHALVARTLSAIFDGADFSAVGLVSLTELLFAMIDFFTDARALLDIQNILLHVTFALGREG